MWADNQPSRGRLSASCVCLRLEIEDSVGHSLREWKTFMKRQPRPQSVRWFHRQLLAVGWILNRDGSRVLLPGACRP
jgi:hypothetical protein